MVQTPKLNFWGWFFYGTEDSKSGVALFINKWLYLHIVVAFVCLALDNSNLSKIASVAVLPFSGALLGMTFAWAGNITALLGTDQLSDLTEYIQGGIARHVYTVQLSILAVLVTCIGWTLAAAEIIVSDFWRFMLYFFSSLAIRECWQTILFAQYMTICRDYISKQQKLKNLK